MASRKTLLIGFLAVAALSAAQAALSQKHREPQCHFSAEEDGVEAPVQMPSDVLDILRSDGGVKNILKSENIPSEDLPVSWFSASAIRLGRDRKTDLIVVGKPPLAGANIVPFWVFGATPRDTNWCSLLRRMT